MLCLTRYAHNLHALFKTIARHMTDNVYTSQVTLGTLAVSPDVGTYRSAQVQRGRFRLARLEVGSEIIVLALICVFHATCSISEHMCRTCKHPLQKSYQHHHYQLLTAPHHLYLLRIGRVGIGDDVAETHATVYQQRSEVGWKQFPISIRTSLSMVFRPSMFRFHCLLPHARHMPKTNPTNGLSLTH